jgi:hypothetical protein
MAEQLQQQMDFNTFRNRFSEADRSITLDQFRALSLEELNGLIRDANLSRPDAGQARLFHPSSQPGKFPSIVSIQFLILCFYRCLI